jgi:hypothetical protein
MALLTRFKKAGGFAQLWTVIEECSHAKRQNLVQLVFEEDPGWGCLILKKMLTPAKLLRWPEKTLYLIFKHANEKDVATLYFLASPAQQQSWMSSFNDDQKSAIESVDKAKLNPESLNAAFDSVLKLIRNLENRGLIVRDQIDPALYVDDRLVS